ncbi:MAG: 50S ribosomal protein L13 [Planctomycetota bacterium]|nr:50S ribosomal protein L13 [Planctomycetota bacterium]
MSRRQTYLAKTGEMTKTWRIVDAEGVPLGRLAAEIAMVLMGKHRPEYTPHVDTGEGVIVTNATKVVLTGRKAEQRVYMWYTKYPGGHKARSYGHLREHTPELLIQNAVRRMLPKNRLSRVMMKNLRVAAGAEHEFANLSPSELKVNA